MNLILFNCKRNSTSNYKRLIREGREGNKREFNSFIEACSKYYFYGILEKDFNEDSDLEKKLIEELKSTIIKLNENLKSELDVENYNKIACKIVNEGIKKYKREKNPWII